MLIFEAKCRETGGVPRRYGDGGAVRRTGKYFFPAACSKMRRTAFIKVNLTLLRKMNKFLAITALSALAFTGCMDDDNGKWKEQQQVMPGMSIYNSTMMQQNISMQMAGAGLRLASLLAEAEKQNPGKPLAEIELDKIKVKLDKSEYTLQILLFGPGTKITKSGPEGWLISYAEGTQQADGYILEGSLKVNTGNAEQLAGTSYPDNMWSVEMQPDFVIKAISRNAVGNNEQTTIQMKDGKTSLFRDPSGTAAYVVTLENIRANFETTSSGKEYVSAWNGRLTLTPEEDESVAFSDIWDDDLKADGAAQGLSIYANSTETAPMGLSYKVQGGVYNFFSRVASNSVGVYTQIVEGSQICEFMQVGDYDPTLFPSPKVECKWTYEGGRLSYTVFYNGFSYTI